jgi:hypothetical protein
VQLYSSCPEFAVVALSESDIEYCYAFKTARLVDVQVHGYMLIIYASIRSFPV